MSDCGIIHSTTPCSSREPAEVPVIPTPPQNSPAACLRPLSLNSALNRVHTTASEGNNFMAKVEAFNDHLEQRLAEQPKKGLQTTQARSKWLLKELTVSLLFMENCYSTTSFEYLNSFKTITRGWLSCSDSLTSFKAYIYIYSFFKSFNFFLTLTRKTPNELVLRN